MPMFVFVLEHISFACLKAPSVDRLASMHLAVFSVFLQVALGGVYPLYFFV